MSTQFTSEDPKPRAEEQKRKNIELLNNILRIFNMLENALKRLERQNYYNKCQCSDIFFHTEKALKNFREWIQAYKLYSSLDNFYGPLGILFEQLQILFAELLLKVVPVPGKRQHKKSRLSKERHKIIRSITDMLEHIKKYLQQQKKNDRLVEDMLGESLIETFLKFWKQKAAEEAEYQLLSENEKEMMVSKRGEKTYIFPCKDYEDYLSLVNDNSKFRAVVVDLLDEYQHATGHKSTCKGHKKYKMAGFRPKPRKVWLVGGKQCVIPVRMVKCLYCGEKFSLLPSFLPREKHREIKIIGNVLQNLLLFGQSVRAVLENLKTIVRGKVKSKQTIFNWLRWMGIFHPAAILTRAGIEGSGYLQEDEGFEKEPSLPTYSVVMVDAKYLLVWHSDYVDNVNEERLVQSFGDFVEKSSFKVLGITKDKWKASTNAIKSVFHRIWIGYCHRHCLKKFYQALLEYQKETKCSSGEVSNLYQQVKRILNISNSQNSLEFMLQSLDGEAFKHPKIQERIMELKQNAKHYTVNMKRKGIARTTSLVDNFLKTVKRKLRQVESFRDPIYARLTFRAMANVRNFVPFCSGAKNAHKSPFMLAGGQTFDLPWIQVMNVQNAFLFTKNAL